MLTPLSPTSQFGRLILVSGETFLSLLGRKESLHLSRREHIFIAIKKSALDLAVVSEIYQLKNSFLACGEAR